MSTLNAFLHPVRVENKEVVVSNRFQEDGRVVPFIIRPINEKENGQLMKKHMKKDKSGKESFNRTEYAHELVATAVVFPDLTNTELQKAYGVLGKCELLTEMLNIGEFAALSEEVSSLSGLDTDINDDIEEVKN